MARLGLAIHEFLWGGASRGGSKLVDPKAKPWDDSIEYGVNC
jgi:hypothetical protein